MLALTPNSPIFEWDYSISTDYSQALQINNNNNHIDFDGVFASSFPCFEDEAQGQNDNKHDQNVWRGESPQSTSTIDQIIMAKKLNHNASERDRRKKINALYVSLRALLPQADHGKKLSVPTTVELVLKYIPNLQKEVDDLNNKKKGLLSKISLFKGGGESSQGKKRKREATIKEKSRHSIFINFLSDQEIVIQISSYDTISLCEVMLLLEKNGLVIVDVSSFQSFGGRSFYNLHLRIEKTNILKCETLNEELLSLIVKSAKRRCM